MTRSLLTTRRSVTSQAMKCQNRRKHMVTHGDTWHGDTWRHNEYSHLVQKSMYKHGWEYRMRSQDIDLQAVRFRQVATTRMGSYPSTSDIMVFFIHHEINIFQIL